MRTHPLSGKIIRAGLLTLLTLGFLCFLYYLNQIEKPPLVNTDGRTFEKAVVHEILEDNLQENGIRIGDQRVSLNMRSGPFKGQTIDAISPNGLLFGASCVPGMHVTAIVSVAGGDSVVTVYSRDREPVIYGFCAVFLLILCLVGGKNGFKSACGLVFTVGCIAFLYLPMIYRGFSPFLAAMLIAAVTTAATMYLVGGATKKTVCAILGTVFGVAVAGISAALFGQMAGISGYNVSEVESLLFVGQNTEIRVGELLFSGILISALGAVMDVAMSISSTVNELHVKNPAMSAKELFHSGMTVGRDAMGTMSNTLILAFVGSSLGVLVMDYAYNLPYIQLVNSYSIGIEVMQGVSGSIGIILTVPLVSLVSAVLMGRKARTEELAL